MESTLTCAVPPQNLVLVRRDSFEMNPDTLTLSGITTTNSEMKTRRTTSYLCLRGELQQSPMFHSHIHPHVLGPRSNIAWTDSDPFDSQDALPPLQLQNHQSSGTSATVYLKDQVQTRTALASLDHDLVLRHLLLVGQSYHPVLQAHRTSSQFPTSTSGIFVNKVHALLRVWPILVLRSSTPSWMNIDNHGVRCLRELPYGQTTCSLRSLAPRTVQQL